MGDERLRSYDKGELIFREGEAGDLMYVLVEGSVDLKKKVEHGETVLKTVDSPNDFFGEMALIDARPRSASAVAKAPTKVLAIDGETFESMILSNGRFALKIIKILADRIRTSNAQISELIETLPRERIARAMVDFATRHGEPIHEGAIKVASGEMRTWINGNVGVSLDDIDAELFRFLKFGSIHWAPTSSKTREYLVLPESFVKANERRVVS
jgi:CRP/FNR family cyclic AMP-dependent transcriptional regulator